jgi:pSer/pThr/pTyr-binding forkhead associated (FHA) protein
MSESRTEHPTLVVIDGPHQGKQWQVVQDEIVAGRDETCDIFLPERPISRQHVKIYRHNDNYYVQDLESKNGTWLNGKKIEGNHPLSNGDVIELAKAVRLHFSGADNATSTLPFAVEVPEGRLKLDLEGRRVFIMGTEIDPPLSLPQYRLLELLWLHPGRICTREQVIEAVWPDVMEEGVSEQAVDALVRRLRDRIEEVDSDAQYIVTIRGHGFRLDNPPNPE